jgi:hypothetical protein
MATVNLELRIASADTWATIDELISRELEGHIGNETWLMQVSEAQADMSAGEALGEVDPPLASRELKQVAYAAKKEIGKLVKARQKRAGSKSDKSQRRL